MSSTGKNSCSALKVLVQTNLVALRRDRVLWSLAAVALLLLTLVPVITLFSMRQVQEFGVSLSLSSLSLFLLVATVFLGATSIWRDLERRYGVSILSLPVSRSQFVVAKFLALAFFLLLCALVLGLVSALGILIATGQHQPDRPLLWGNFCVAICMIWCRYVLLLSTALLLSAFSTSFFLPVFGTLGVYLAGNVSFQVMEFVVLHRADYPALFVYCLQGLYYLLPNLSAFDFQVYAIYSLPLPWPDVWVAFGYFCVYSSLALLVTNYVFGRREV